MQTIHIDIKERRAQALGSPVLICGNTDAMAIFTFDEEWAEAGAKTARFAYERDGKVHHQDVVFIGDTVNIPMLSNIRAVRVGVYAGDLMTTTPAVVPCEPSILCGSGVPEEPPEDVYNQIMELFGDIVFNADMQELARKVNENAAAIASVAEDCDAAADEVAELSGQCDTNTEQIAALNNRCDTLTDDVRALSGQGGTYSEQFDELRGACEANTQNVQTLTDSVSTLTDSVSALTEDCRESLETVAEFSGQCAANKDDIAALNTRCENIDNDLNAATQTANKNKTDLSTLSGKHDALAAEVEELAESVDLVTRPSVRWCAMGDSITYGYTSAFSSGQTPNGINRGSHKYLPAEAWVAKLAALNNWDAANKGVSNTGWVHHNDNKTDAAWNKAAEIDFSSYDIVTLAFGINDWGYNETLGTMEDSYASPTTIIGGMRKTIETIIASNPYCKIFVITPLNRLGNYMTDSDGNPVYLQESYNWALGLKKTKAGTLEDVFNGIKSVCDYYGVEMIDMTHSSVVNRKNLHTLLPDYVHPSTAAHTALARELSAKINFK